MSKVLLRQDRGRTSFLIGGEGEAFLLVHGMPGSALRWKPIGELLMSRYRVVIPDLLGFGESYPAESDYFFEGQARALKQLLDTLEIEELYIGCHDFGVAVSLTLLYLYPQLAVRGLVISDAHIFSDTFKTAPLSIKMSQQLGKARWLQDLLMGTDFGLRNIYKLYTQNKIRFTWEQFRRQINPKSIITMREIMQRLSANFEADYSIIESTLADIAAPTLIAWGADDPIALPSTAQRLQQSIPNSKLVIYPNTGHFVPEEQPERMARDILDYFGEAQ